MGLCLAQLREAARRSLEVAPERRPNRAGANETQFIITSNEKALATEGFFEPRVITPYEVWAHFAVVVTPYEVRHAPGEAPFARGIKHFELTSDGKRWFVESVVWEGETTASPLPPEAAAALQDRHEDEQGNYPFVL